MKFVLLAMVLLAVLLVPMLAAAETRTYTEKVTVKVEDDEFTALKMAKTKALEQALADYVNDVYPDRSGTLNLTGDDKFVKDMEVLESNVTGWVGKELTARIKITINEEEVRAYLKRQGVVKGKNQERRIIVLLVKDNSVMDSGDAPVILDNLRAEVRNSLAEAKFRIIDNDDQAIQDNLTEDGDYNKMVSQLNRIASKLSDRAEWLIIAKVGMHIVKNGDANVYHTLMTGKLVNLSNRSLMWEGNIDESARSGKAEKLRALRQSAMTGGKSFAAKVVGAIKADELTGERMGEIYELYFQTGGDFNVESKIDKALGSESKDLKDINPKDTNGGGMYLIELKYVGKIRSLVKLLVDNFARDPELRGFKPKLDGNKVTFRK